MSDRLWKSHAKIMRYECVSGSVFYAAEYTMRGDFSKFKFPPKTTDSLEEMERLLDVAWATYVVGRDARRGARIKSVRKA